MIANDGNQNYTRVSSDPAKAGAGSGQRPDPSSPSCTEAEWCCLSQRKAAVLHRAANRHGHARQQAELGAILHGRVLVAELCCSGSSSITAVADQVLGANGGLRIGLESGYNLLNPVSFSEALATLREKRPAFCWCAVPCGPWSSLQNLSVKTAEQRMNLHTERQKSIRLMLKVMELCRVAAEEWGAGIAWEHPRSAASWHLNIVRRFVRRHGVGLYQVDGCAYGFRIHNELVKKPWTIACTSTIVGGRVQRVCQGNHVHCRIEGGRTAASAFYPRPLAQQIVSAMMAVVECRLRHSTEPVSYTTFKSPHLFTLFTP